MELAVTGATGFIGKRLLPALEQSGHSIRLLTRKPGRSATGTFVWDPVKGQPPEAALSGAEAIVHLAGEPVAQRWTAEAKKGIRESRVLGTKHLVQALSTAAPRPKTLICASAIGYYGDRGNEVLTEESAPGKGFLPDTCVEWEREARLAEALGIRVVRLRIGVVLGPDGGALEKMLPPFKAGVGGPLAGGRQWMSWIHLDDLIEIILFCLQNEAISGAVNGTGPNPVTNAEFSRQLGSALSRPALFPIPALAIKMLYGEMAEVVLGSQRVLPKRTQQEGFKFQYPDLNQALKQILG